MFEIIAINDDKINHVYVNEASFFIFLTHWGRVTHTQQTRDATTTSLSRRNDVATSFRRNNGVIIAPCARWNVYMRWGIGSSLNKTMVWRLLGVKPLYWQLDPKEHITMKFYLKCVRFQFKNMHMKMSANCSPFVAASMCLIPDEHSFRQQNTR